MKLPLNRGLQTYWLNVSEADEKPVIVKHQDWITFPALITKTTKVVTDEMTKKESTKTVYQYYPVELEFKGDDITNYTKVMRSRVGELREYFYGPQWAQSEMEAKGLWTLHAMAVRAVFAKVEGEVPTALENFWEAWTSFWKLIAQTCQAYNIPYDVIPEYFDSTYMITVATLYKIPDDQLQLLLQKMQLIQFDVLANKFVWKNLFPKPEDPVLNQLL